MVVDIFSKLVRKTEPNTNKIELGTYANENTIMFNNDITAIRNSFK